MEIAITVTAVPSQDNLLLDVAAALQRDFNGALEFRWLGQGEAMDLILPGRAPETPRLRLWRGGAGSFKDMVAEAAGNRPVDWCVQPAEGRKKRMLIADMDSTTIGQESIDEMAELKGIRPEIAAITERSMRGELEFESGLRERMRLLRGMTEADLQRVLGRLTLNPGARTLVHTMKSHGAHTVLVSGGFTYFHERRRRASRIRRRTGAMSSYGMTAALRAPPSLFKDGKPSLPH